MAKASNNVQEGSKWGRLTEETKRLLRGVGNAAPWMWGESDSPRTGPRPGSDPETIRERGREQAAAATAAQRKRQEIHQDAE
jgi:hypothetical protein